MPGLRFPIINRQSVYIPTVNCKRAFSTSKPKTEEKTEDVISDSQEIPDNDQKLMEENYSKAVKELEVSQQLVKDLHNQLLLKYADAENKRRERLADLKRRGNKHIAHFGEKIALIHESLENVCDKATKRSHAPESSDKVKAFTEGLTMTQGIFKNVLEKHNIKQKKTSE